MRIKIAIMSNKKEKFSIQGEAFPPTQDEKRKKRKLK
jgi:hypothetical protein